jgi:putative glutamine amidotransferase
MFYKRKKILFGLILLLCFSCTGKKEAKEIRTTIIAISKGQGHEHYNAYAAWVKRSDNNILCVDLYHMKPDSIEKIMKIASGLILSGGPDVGPQYYDRAADSIYCYSDPYRDSLEFQLIQSALDRKIPILAICRGQQIINVAMGGTLLPDIPEFAPSAIRHRCQNKDSCYHPINIVPHSFLFRLIRKNNLMVNSNHHQCIRKLSDSFIVNAYAADGIIESITWKNPQGKSFLLGVQWHPERMKNALSDSIITHFLSQSKSK